jgi:hypothetical protein
MNLLDLFTKGLDWWSKFSSRLRGLGMLVAVIFAILFLVNNGCKRQQIEELVEKTTGLNVQNDILKKTNNQLAVKIENKDSIIARKSFQVDSIANKLERSNQRIWYWKNKYIEIDDKLKDIPYDSSYKFTQQIYNYPGEKIYLYNGLQVNGIHRTWLQKKNIETQLTDFEMSLHDCQNQIALMEDVNKTMDEKFALKESQLMNTNSIIENKDEEINLLQKHLKRNNKWFAGFGIGPELGIGYDFVNQNRILYLGVGIHYNLYKW